jgi:hypothetical protein
MIASTFFIGARISFRAQESRSEAPSGDDRRYAFGHGNRSIAPDFSRRYARKAGAIERRVRQFRGNA